MLPSRVLRLMEFLGFSGDRVGHATLCSSEPLLCHDLVPGLACLNMLQELGLAQLREGAASNSLRSILSTLTLLMFHLYMSVILGEKTFLYVKLIFFAGDGEVNLRFSPGTGEGNLPEAEALLKPYAEKFPNVRYCKVMGNIIKLLLI